MGIRYKSGYKYVLARNYSVYISVGPVTDVGNDYAQLNPAGLLRISAGYAWDGPSGPTFDTPSFLRGSLVHDVLYQLMRLGLLDTDSWREVADLELRRMCREDGMSAVRAWYVYQAVRIFGASSALPGSEPIVREAP